MRSSRLLRTVGRKPKGGTNAATDTAGTNEYVTAYIYLRHALGGSPPPGPPALSLSPYKLLFDPFDMFAQNKKQPTQQRFYGVATYYSNIHPMRCAQGSGNLPPVHFVPGAFVLPLDESPVIPQPIYRGVAPVTGRQDAPTVLPAFLLRRCTYRCLGRARSRTREASK